MIQLKGHSGCSVVLLDGGAVVRKTAPDQSYNRRLSAQADKQSNFHHPSIKAPQVLRSGVTEDGKFYFDMPYVRGRRLSSFFKVERLSVCMGIVDQLDVLHEPNSEMDILPRLSAKLDELGVDVETRDLVLDADWKVPMGFCHGDLTFENVIVSDDGIYLIDFLDSFVDSPIIDQSKMLQDAFCYWSFDPHSYIPKRKLMSVCEKYATGLHYRMLLVHLIRILPYSDDATKERVRWMVRKTKDKINRL